MKNLETLSFCTCVLYKKNKDYSCDFSSSPRPCHNIAFILEGEGVITTETTVINVKKGDILYIPLNSTYVSNWKATPNCMYHSVHFNFPLGKDPFYGKKIPVQLLPNQDFDELFEMVKTIAKYQASKELEHFYYLSAFYNLCAKLLPSAKFSKTTLQKNNISPAIDYLEKNFTKPCTVADLASLCFLSSSRFFYLFKKLMGCSPITYKNKLAIQKSIQILFLDKTSNIEEIAFQCGFPSPIYVRRLFKKITGKTPTEYRKTFQVEKGYFL